MHRAPHIVCPVAHAQRLALHEVPVAHAVPQAPQLAMSVRVSVHCPPHATCPVGHAQLPAVQRCPMEHA